MIDLDREIRALLEEDARRAPPAPDPRAAIRRGRRRQLGVVLTALAVVAAVAAGSIAGVSALMRSSEQIPVGPSETSTPSATSPAPVVSGPPPVLSGSGLDGYIATSFPTEGTPRGLAVAPDGTVWAVIWEMKQGNPYVTSLGRFDGDSWTTYAATEVLPGGLDGVAVAPDGTVWVVGEGGLARLDGETWTSVLTGARVFSPAFAPDGSILVGVQEGIYGFPDVARFDGETWSTLPNPEPVRQPGLWGLEVAPDGTVWTSRGNLFASGVSRFDGSAWSTWGNEELGPPADVLAGAGGLAVAPDGSVWVLLGEDTVRFVARFDRGTWTVFRLPPWPSWNLDTYFASGPDGTIWVGVGGGSGVGGGPQGLLFSFDGSSWTKDRLGGDLEGFEVAPDGTLWVAVGDSLVRFTPVQS